MAECSKSESQGDSWQTSKSSFSSDSSRTSVSHEIKNIWQIIMDCSKSSPESLGLFEDDLTCLLQKNSIPNSVELLIKENVLAMTKHVFQIDAKYQLKLKEYADKLSSFKHSYDLGLVDHSNGALNLLPQMMNDLQNKSLLVSDAKASPTTCLPCITLASSFRLIAALERQNIAELKDYLGMPILTLNELADSTNLINKFRSVYNDDEKRLVCDSLFYIINWFIELVNAFSVKLSGDEDDDLEISTKLITRLNNIHELQTVLLDILPFMVYYRPPIAVFGLIDSSTEELPYVTSVVKSKDSKKKKPSKQVKRKKGKENKKPMKKKKKNADEDEEDMDADGIMDKDEDEMEENEELDEDMEEKELVEDTEDEEEDRSMFDSSCVNKLAEVDMNKLSFYFREFDLTILNFLKLRLEIVESIPDSSSSRTNQSNKNSSLKLKPALFDFVLSDLNKKLPLILKSSTSTQTSLKPAFAQPKPTKMNLFIQLNMFDSERVIKVLMNDCFDSICENLNDISMFVKNIQEKNDNIRDSAELCNNPNNLCLFKCVNQLLKLINVMFVWLHGENDTKVIDEAVKKIGSKLNVSSMSVSTQCDKAPEIFCYKYLSTLKDIVLDLNSAHVLIQLLELLCNKIFPKKRSLPETYEKKCRKILTETCKEFLLNDYNKKISDSLSLSKQSMNEAITNILNVLIKNDENSLEIVERLVEIIASESFMQDRDNCEEFNTLKSHFNSYYKTLIEYTVNNLKFVEKYDFDIIHSNRKELNELVLKIKRMVTLHCSLVNLKQSAAFKEINILSVLKNSKLFLNNFLKYIMPWLDQAFEYHKEDVVAILQELQKTVHYLQEICMTNNNFSVSKQTPVYMRCVESFLLRVKQLLYVNRYDNAFTVDLFQNRFKKVTNNNKTASAKKDSKTVKKTSKKGKKKGSDAEEEEIEDEDESEKDKENLKESDDDEVEDEEDSSE